MADSAPDPARLTDEELIVELEEDLRAERQRLAAYENLRAIANRHIRQDDVALSIYGEALAALDRLDQGKP